MCGLRMMEALCVCGCAKRHRIALSGLGIAIPMAPLFGECGCFLFWGARNMVVWEEGMKMKRATTTKH